MIARYNTDIVSELKKRMNSFTPDYLKLKESEFHFVFVYGTLKTGFSNNRLLTGVPFLGGAHTCLPSYVMEDAGSFPVIRRIDTSVKSEKSRAGYIVGEVYACPAEVLLDLDTLEANGQMYERKKIWVFLDDQEYKLKSATASPSVSTFTYLAHPSWAFGRSGEMRRKTIDGRSCYSWDDKKYRNEWLDRYDEM